MSTNGDMPAFSAPNIIASGSHNTINAPSGTGLTKRELFAAMAMQGMLSTEWARSAPIEQIERWSVDHADALLTALDASRPVEPKS